MDAARAVDNALRIRFQAPIGASHKRTILDSIIGADGKFGKPFFTGSMAGTSILGGTWNDYAQVVVSVVIADTLIEIEESLKRIESKAS